MKITRPEDTVDHCSSTSQAIMKFEEQMNREEMNQDYYHLVIIGDYSREVCNRVEELYRQAGWKNVKCTTSSEKGERAGLTGLQLWKNGI